MPITFLVDPECTERKPDVPSVPNEFLTLLKKFLARTKRAKCTGCTDWMPSECRVHAECLPNVRSSYLAHAEATDRIPRLNRRRTHSAAARY